ncbi:MOSC domain-containing protein [Jeotgalibacillus proteolyticus]|uniref:MOSC domain-containing protein n=1 Tax=Jeotgalibacillus proteolyticus TaxID=2082395 RepID=A0A2S5GCY2_9BACL|nr:MOSC domain-containing protein [Jeotgalibacillus proteolyticus]PPA70764.1 MOSC domain-containing protein [Jeotgalibacillus proteolyticus]
MQTTTYQVHSLNVGKIEKLTYGTKSFESAIRKSAAVKPVWISVTGISDDEQAYEQHGGTEKALCLYPYDYKEYWNDLLGHLDHDALFGENLSTLGLTEENTCVGDTFQLGEAVVQVTEPRQPCYKLAAKYDIPDIVSRMQKTGYTGFMFRVLKEGYAAPGDPLELIEKDPLRISIRDVNKVKYNKKASAEELNTILSLKALSATLRETLLARLNKLA